MALGHLRGVMERGAMAWETPSHKLVALVAAYHADRRGIIRLTQGEIGEESGLSRRRVADIMDALCDQQVFARLGHGRYGVRFGKTVESPELELEHVPKPFRSTKRTDREVQRMERIAAEAAEVGLDLSWLVGFTGEDAHPIMQGENFAAYVESLRRGEQVDYKDVLAALPGV